MHEVLNISGTVLRSFALSATFQKKTALLHYVETMTGIKRQTTKAFQGNEQS